MAQQENSKGGKSRGGQFQEVRKEFQEELLRIDRVTRVTAGGRQLRFRVSLVIGDGKGTVGLGIGKAGEVVVAIEKATRDAKKNLVRFEIHNGTIAHDVAVNFKAVSLLLHPADAGTGIIAGGSIRKVLAVAGIKDVLAKRHSASKNPITAAHATIKALSSLKRLGRGKATEVVAPVASEVVEETPVAPTEAAE